MSVQECRTQIAEIRAAWSWLAEQRFPGPTDPPSERHVTAEQAAVEAREVHRDRQARYLPPAAAGTADRPSGAARYLHALPPSMAAGPHADAARVGAVHGRIMVSSMLRRAAEHTHAQIRGKLTWRLRDPNPRAGTPCYVCKAVEQCGCDLDDAQVATALHILTVHLQSMGEAAAQTLLPSLQRINQQARRAAGAADVLLVLKAACPACDSRDLVADCTSPNRDEWSIRCRNGLCQCAGQGCACGRIVRVPGKPHLWPAARGQWHDLARKLGVPLAGLIADAMRRPAPHASARTGTGGRS